MLLYLDAADPSPLHEQLVGGIRRAIAEGRCRPGDRLPPAKDLAEQLDVNANTVLRALRQLRDEGLLEFRRGRGISVTDAAPAHAAVARAAAELDALARQHGYSRAELMSLIERLP
ncbi:MAG TPA: GntR family transcriptional regulator [Candidatus Stackebrandtia excrementipullorum]|nr:GntR family transcriptional regulator [Candidatus Stackebrandtia excrementipullorum]